MALSLSYIFISNIFISTFLFLNELYFKIIHLNIQGDKDVSVFENVDFSTDEVNNYKKNVIGKLQLILTPNKN